MKIIARFLGVLLCLLFIPLAAYAGEARLTWERPTTNEDGTCLTDLAGFKLYYSTTPADHSSFDDIGDVTCTDTGIDAGTGCGNVYSCAYTKKDLGDGTWYFFVTAYDFTGHESDYSNQADTLIDTARPKAPVINECVQIINNITINSK